MKRSKLILLACFAVLILSIQLTPVQADIDWSGDLDPDDPTTWDSSPGTYVYIGKDSNGTLDITSGSKVSDFFGYIGYNSGSTGKVTVDGNNSEWMNLYGIRIGYEGSGTLNITEGGTVINSISSYIGTELGSTGEVTVDGVGSTWSITERDSLGIEHGRLDVGLNGNGTLNITNGGLVSNVYTTMVAHLPGSSGKINFDNGTLTTSSLFSAGDNLTGTGTINTRGLVSDVNLVFNSISDLNQTFTLHDNPGQNITVNLNVDGTQSLGVGHDGIGTMSISGMAVVESTSGYIGYNPGSTGEVTVDGHGFFNPTWTNSDPLYVGRYGGGTLNIIDGGKVSNTYAGYIGCESGSTGQVTVSGANSEWAICDRILASGTLYVGYNGNGTLNINRSGLVTVSGHSCIGDQPGSTGQATVDGAGSMLTSQGDLSVNNGTLDITLGGEVSNREAVVNSTGRVTVDGAGSTWTNRANLAVDGRLNITEGGQVINGVDYPNLFYLERSCIGWRSGSMGQVIVHGAGSVWTSICDLCIGDNGSGALNITYGGLVSVAGTLTIDQDADRDSCINMSTGGMLALCGDGDGSLEEFLSMVCGTDAIQYWDDSISDWTHISGATYGEDYTLEYLAVGDLAGYTVLTVLAVPEPSTLASLFGLSVAGLLILLRRKQ